MQVTPKNFFTDFLLNPLSKQISKVDRAICLVASVILGVFTAGFLHLSLAIYNWSARNASDRTFERNEAEERIDRSGRAAIGHRRTPSADKRDLKEIQKEKNSTIILLRERVENPDHLAEYIDLCDQIYDNASQLLAECAEEPEVRRFIIEGTKSDLSGLISTAAGVEESVPEAQNSFNHAKWAQELTTLIRRGRSRYKPEMSDQLDELLKRGLDANARDSVWIGGTALHHLAKLGKPTQFVEVFANNGVDFSIRDNWDNTALLWAIANGQNSMAFEILNYKQDLDIRGHGNTALHLAIAKGYKDRTSDGARLTVSNLQLVQKLAANGADTNLSNERGGYTALHLAFVRRDPEMIKVLLDNGADLSIKTSDGRTCQELLECSYEDAKDIIRGVTPPYLLPKEDFDSGYEACLDLVK